MNQQLDNSAPARWNTPALHLAAVTLVWLASLCIVNPIGNFPLNDDWSFGLAVKHLLENGDFRPTGWTSMPLITNTLWGSLFCLPGGFSFTASRVSTLAAAWLGICGLYLLVRELRQPPGLALLAALTLAFNPIFYSLSNTFMTDVPYVTLTIFAALFFVKHLGDDSRVQLLLGTGFALAATLSRQVGLAVPLAFAITLVARRGRGWRVIVRAVVPLLVCIGALAVFQHWLAATGRMPALYNAKNEYLLEKAGNVSRLGLLLASSIFKCCLYFGLFLSPVLILTFPFSVRILAPGKMRQVAVSLTGLGGLTVVYGLAGKGYLMPLAGNVLDKAGVGPLTLPDVFRYPQHPGWMPVLPAYFWLAVTLLSLLGAAILTVQMGSMAGKLAPRLRPGKLGGEESAGVFLLLIGIVYLGPFMSGFLDRYLVPVIPFFAAGIISLLPPASPARPRLCLPGAALLIASFFLFSICGTRDYLAWNRLRWQALDRLMTRQRVKPADINGGFEFNGYYLYRADYQTQPGKDFWWVEGDTYQITFHPVPGCTVLDQYRYTHWMPPYIGKIYVLKSGPQEVLEPGATGGASLRTQNHPP